MSDPRITRSEFNANPPRPAAGPVLKQGAPSQPKMGGDALSLGSQEPVTGSGARETLDKNGWWASTQTFLQGATRAGSLAARAMRSARVVTAIADVLEGNAQTISRGVQATTDATKAFFTKVAPKYADDAMKAAGPVIRGGGTVLRAVGKAAPFVSVVAAGWDTYKAISENDPAKKAGAWANATLSVGGTAAALGAIALGATPVGWALGIGAAAVAGFQLVDNLAFDGKGTQAIGDAAKAVGGAVADGAAAIGRGAANAGNAIWNTITSL